MGQVKVGLERRGGEGETWGGEGSESKAGATGRGEEWHGGGYFNAQQKSGAPGGERRKR